MSRSYCFTLNNYTLEEEIALRESQFRYIIFEYETGESGTPHLQGYLELEKPQRISFFKKHEGLKRAHLEKRMGTRDEAREYCMKENNYIEFGNWEAGGQGRRTDLKKLMEVIRDPERDIKEIMEEYPKLYSKNIRFCEKYLALCERDETKQFRNVEVELYIGEAGTGKSKKVHEENPEIFTVNPEDTFPFDGYDGEPTIVIEDFEGQLKYKQLLKILDGHQLRLNVKGSHRYAKYTKVFITTNEEPETWYQRGMTPALKRRIHKVTRFCNEEGGNTEPPLLNI